MYTFSQSVNTKSTIYTVQKSVKLFCLWKEGKMLTILTLTYNAIQKWVKEEKPPVKMTFKKVGRKPSSNTVENQNGM